MMQQNQAGESRLSPNFLNFLNLLISFVYASSPGRMIKLLKAMVPYQTNCKETCSPFRQTRCDLTYLASCPCYSVSLLVVLVILVALIVVITNVFDKR